jgi:hypothetical protein
MTTPRLALLLVLATAAAPLGAGAPGSARATGTGGAAPAASSAPLEAAPLEADPCDAAAGPLSTEAAGSLAPAARRVAVACALREAMASRYVFWPVKGRLLAAADGALASRDFDPRAHLDACVEAERAIDVEDEPLRFYDRMRRCVSAFEDGHLILSVPARLPAVALGVGFRLAGGKVVVANVEAALVAELEATRGPAGLAALLVPGAEVVAVDGVPALDAVDALAALVPGSSAAARRERAVDALGRRDFAHPERPAARLSLAAPSGRVELELPWWIAPGAASHALAAGYVARTGLATTELVDWRADPVRDADARGRLGARRSDPIVPAAEAARLRVLRGENGQVAVRLGEVTRAGETAAYCYAQVLTFHTETLADADGKRPFTSVLSDFVAGCDAAGRDLVLDLRQNEGGYISHSTALAQALTPAGRATPGGALLLRATAQNERVYTERAPVVGGSADEEPPLGPRRILEAIGAARRTNREFTPAFLERPLAPVGGGFRGRVVALVSPACMSACDRLAGLLRAGGRAVLVGGPTEGAGGSQQETKGQSARWTDPAGLLTVSIPNAAMGLQRAAQGSAGESSADAFFEALAFENRPVEPHVSRATTVEDVRGANAGWRAAAEAQLTR